MAKLNKYRSAFVLAVILLTLIFLYSIRYRFYYFFHGVTEGMPTSYTIVGNWSFIGNMIEDYYEDSSPENSENLIDGFIDYHNNRFPYEKFSKEPPVGFDNEKHSAYYLILPKTLENSNCMVIGYSQEIPEYIRGKHRGSFRVFLFLRDNKIVPVAIDAWEAISIIGDDLREGKADFYRGEKEDRMSLRVTESE